jgi:hypothetical protein
MTLSPIVHRLEQEIATLSFEEKLWLLAQIAQQVQPPLPSLDLVQNLREKASDEAESIIVDGRIQREDGVLMIVGAIQENADVLDEIWKERIQELMG